MPKKASIASKSQRASNSSSPSKQPRARRRSPNVQDRSQWRASRISEQATINKAAAISNYHLGRDGLRGVPYAIDETVIKIKGVDRLVPMHLFKERDVELKAWEKHSGPEGFEQYLIAQQTKWYKKHGTNSTKSFPKPDSYKLPNTPNSGGYVMIMSRPKHMPDPETSTPALLKMKQRMQNAGQLWLWDTFCHKFMNSSASDVYIAGRRRENFITGASAILHQYDARPTEPPPESPSFDALAEVLKRAPVGRDQGDQSRDLDVYWYWPEGDRIANWSDHYFDQVYHALNKIIEEHGLQGWKRARWLVYDKYAECIADFEVSESTSEVYEWDDKAIFWLDHKDRRARSVAQSDTRRIYYSLLKKLHVY